MPCQWTNTGMALREARWLFNPLMVGQICINYTKLLFLLKAHFSVMLLCGFFLAQVQEDL